MITTFLKKRRPPTRPNGFTLIELIIAIAISSTMIAAVYSATRTMAHTAKTQEIASKETQRWNRFQEILRRDLKGWISIKQTPTSQTQTPNSPPTPTPTPTDNQQTILFEFPATNDSIAQIINPENTTRRKRSSPLIRYTAIPTSKGYSILRSEGSSQESISLWICQQRPQAHFYDGNNWLEEWKSPKRPKGVALNVDDQIIYILLP